MNELGLFYALATGFSVGSCLIRPMAMTIMSTPLMTEVIVIVHQTPSRPSKNGIDSTKASGTLEPVKMTDMMAGGFVLPKPL